jgi:gluconolactonase
MDWDVVAHGYGLAEAPTIDVDGSLVFSDVLGGGVYRVDAAAKVTTVVPKRRGVGGIAIHEDGGIVCSGRDLVHVREGYESRTVLHVDGVAGWNDVCTDAAGRVYAGALRFAVFDPEAQVVPGELWRVALDGDATVVFGDVVHANGVACTADGSTIYLSDSRRQRIIVFDVQRAIRREIDMSALGHPDGMALDEHGAVWVALVSGGIARLTPDGDIDRRLEPPSAFTTSLCFAGRDLYVTTGGHSGNTELRGCVLRTTVDVAGAPVAPARISTHANRQRGPTSRDPLS